VSSYYAAPLLIANGRGLIVNTGHYSAVSYYHGPAYGAQKAGARDFGTECTLQTAKRSARLQTAISRLKGPLLVKHGGHQLESVG
jgi:hypothetical protein